MRQLIHALLIAAAGAAHVAPAGAQSSPPPTGAQSLPATPAQSSPPLGADAFEAFVAGRTMAYSLGGEIFGTEIHLSDRRVLWTFRDGTCHSGRWYPQGEQICFAYEDIGTPQCWTYRRQGGSLTASYAGDPPGAEPFVAQSTDEALPCPGFDVGV